METYEHLEPIEWETYGNLRKSAQPINYGHLCCFSREANALSGHSIGFWFFNRMWTCLA